MAIHTVIDARLDGRAPTSAASPKSGSQFAMELSTAKGRPLWASAAWMAEGELIDRDEGVSRATAEALLRGAPEVATDPVRSRALAFAYFGAVPLTPDGGAWAFAPQGITDPARGDFYAPVWPAVPVAGSPVAALLDVIANARADLSFDDEGKDSAGQPMKSLHAHVRTVIH
jgi:hypothetical protein